MTSLEKGLNELQISYNDYKINQLNEYYNILFERNLSMNLTAITEYEEVVLKHFIDSLSLVKAIPELLEGKRYRILDMGTGAGFPGIPLKIMFPELEFVLMDSLNKRVKFLNEVIEKIGLTDIVAIHARAEEAGRNKKYRESFDLCVSRAVARLASLSEFCLPFVKLGGYFIAYKSGGIREEIDETKNAIHLLGAKLYDCTTFILPGSDIERSLIMEHKVKNTPSIYPRTGGRPLKNPL